MLFFSTIFSHPPLALQNFDQNIKCSEYIESDENIEAPRTYDPIIYNAWKNILIGFTWGCSWSYLSI